MVVHSELRPDPVLLPLTVAEKAMRIALTAQTRNAGSLYVPNGDGTGTLIGEQSGKGEDGTANGIIPWVDDVTPPGKPTGVGVSSAWGSLIVSWDGSLDGGVPPDFAHLSVLVDGVERSRLREKGSAWISGFEHGDEPSVSVIAYDDAHDTRGNPTPNASEPWGPVTVTIVDQKTQIDADVDQIRQDMESTAGELGETVDGMRDTVSAVESSVEGLKADVADAAGKADSALSAVGDVTVRVNGVEQSVSGLSSVISKVAETAEGAADAASKVEQDLDGFKATVSETYQPKGDYATGSDLESYATKSEVEQTADRIRAEVAESYQGKGDYATKSEVEQTASSIRSEVSEVAETAEGALSKATLVEQTADGLSATITKVSKTADDAKNAAAAAQSTADDAVEQATELSATVDGVSSRVTAAQSTADKAVSLASTAQQTVDGFKQTVEQEYATKDDVSKTYATKSEVEQTATGIRSEVSAQYQPKGDYATGNEVDKAQSTASSALSKATTVEQNLDGFRTTVSQEYTTKTEFNTISKGDNLWPNQWFDSGKPILGAIASDVTPPNGGSACQLWGRDFHNYSTAIPVTEGHTYRVTVDAKRYKGDLQLNGGIWYLNKTTGNSWDSYRSPTTSTELSDGWARYTYDVKCLSGKQTACVYFQINQALNGAETTTGWYIANLLFQDVTDEVALYSAIDDSAEQTTVSLSSSIEQAMDEISMSVAESYYTNADAQELTSRMETMFSQTSSDFTFQFNELKTVVNGLSSNVDSQFSDLSKYIKFVNGHIIIGVTGNPFSLDIGNDRISFMQNNSEIAYMSNHEFHITSGIITQNLRIGNFEFRPRANGNLSLSLSLSLSLTARNWLDGRTWTDGKRLDLAGAEMGDTSHSHTERFALSPGDYRLTWEGGALVVYEYAYVSGFESESGAYVGRPFTLVSEGASSPVDFTLPSTMPWVIVNLPTSRKGTATLRLRE